MTTACRIYKAVEFRPTENEIDSKPFRAGIRTETFVCVTGLIE